VAHVARELRARQAKIEKKGAGGRAGMTYPEVRRVFPHLKEATVRKHLAEVCDVTKVCADPNPHPRPNPFATFTLSLTHNQR
jgi:hypothetical protein